MKTLFFIRHAKSSWSYSGLNDFDRPLNDRGERDTPIMAKRLFKKGVKLDLLVSSPAARAKTTCMEFAAAFHIKPKQIQFENELYLASPIVYNKLISLLSDELDHVAFFAHNPGITDFVNTLTDVRIDNMPTCSVFAIKTHLKHWNKWNEAIKEFWFFDYPKNENE